MQKYPGVMGGKVSLPPLFSSTVDRNHLDLSWPDFSFYMPRKPHKLRTRGRLHPQMVAESAADLEIRFRSLCILATSAPPTASGSPRGARVTNEMLVNELVGHPPGTAHCALARPPPPSARPRHSWEDRTMAGSTTLWLGGPSHVWLPPGGPYAPAQFIGDHGRINSTCATINRHRQGGFQQHLCYMTFVEQCSYKYLLNRRSATRTSSSTYCYAAPSSSTCVTACRTRVLSTGCSRVYITCRWLTRKPCCDGAMAQGMTRPCGRYGRSRAHGRADIDAVSDFMAELLSQYASKQTFAVRRPLVRSKFTAKTTCGATMLEPAWMEHYLMEDNSTCIRPIPQGKNSDLLAGVEHTAARSRAVPPHMTCATLLSRTCARDGNERQLAPATHRLALT